MGAEAPGMSSVADTERTSASLVRSWNEWDPLEEIVVGSAIGARISRADRSLHAVHFSDCAGPEEIPCGPFAREVVERTEEELARLCEELEALGVVVRRPD